MNVLECVWTCLNIFEHFWPCLNMLEHVSTYLNILKCVWTCFGQWICTTIFIQRVSRKMSFSRCTLQGPLSHKCWWPITHFLHRHGRFCLPKRNSEDKSIMWPTGPTQVRSQNKGYWQYSNIWLKINSSIQIAWLPDIFKSTSPWCWDGADSKEGFWLLQEV